MVVMSTTTVRSASPADLPAVARLRWRWVVEENGTADALDEDEFVATFVAWAAEHSGTHRRFVAERDGTVIGMALLALTARAPSPRAPRRLSGDLLCVYVVPDARDAGVGTRLVEAVVEEADRLGVERVVVHSSERAVPAYDRAGFASDEQLRHRRLRPVGAPRAVRGA
jgi:GNAT superfamily N-acetyltransferase